MPILITQAELRVVRLNLVHEFETSSHRKNHLDHILVRLVATDGDRELVGWGECASPADPFYCGESTESCWQILSEYLVPMVLGKPWETPADAALLTAKVTGNNFAHAGLDMACWDLYAGFRRQPLATLLTENPAEKVVAGVSLGVESTIDALLEQVDRHVGDGYRRVKLKVRPGWDVEPVRAVRDAFPSLPLQVDANTAYSAGDLDHLAQLDKFGLLMIEQPFAVDELLLHAELARQISTPVCLDESITSVAVLKTALALKSASIVNVKVSRLGGIAAAVAVHNVCCDAGIPVWCGGMHEFGVGRSANLAVASLPGFTLPSDLSGSDKYFRADIVSPPIRAVDGLVPVPLAGPGIGVVVDDALVAANTLRTKTFPMGAPATASTSEGVSR